MAIDANSYGTLDGVGALVPRFSGAANNFDETTRPNAEQVEGWIDEVSSILNTQLARLGFAVPIVQADAVRTLAFFVQEECAAMVNGVNGSGRFGPSSRNPQSRRHLLIFKDAKEFLEEFAPGLEDLGATRSGGLADGLSFREFDESGDEIVPLFQREAYGNTVQEWDDG